MKLKRQTHSELADLQRRAGAAIMRRLDRNGYTQKTWTDGRKTAAFVAEFIKPNDRLTSFDRIEIYTRQYWFRLIDCLYDDYPGLRAVVGERKFYRIVEAYLDRYPSRCFTLRNLGDRLGQFLVDTLPPAHPRTQLAIEITRFEWAQVVAFDGPAVAAVTVDELLGANPAKLRLAVQPYITLLELNWPLDDWSIALKKSINTLRSEASNAVESERPPEKKRIPLPRKGKAFVAVHRFENSLYYKRLEPDAFRMLAALRDGQTLEAACAAVPDELVDQVQKWFASWTTMGWFCRRK